MKIENLGYFVTHLLGNKIQNVIFVRPFGVFLTNQYNTGKINIIS